MDDPRDEVLTLDEDPVRIDALRVELAKKLLDPRWAPAILVVADAASLAGDEPIAIAGCLSPMDMARRLRALADELAGHVGARSSWNRAERRRLEREDRGRG